MKPLNALRDEPRDLKATSLVVLLHGYGANGADLLGLGKAWRKALPATAFVAPDAPEALSFAADGYQWFPLTMRDPGEYWRGVSAAGPQLDKFIDAELARYGLSERRMAIVGFSQGTMMALHVGLRRAPPPAAILGFAGLIAGPEHLPKGSTNRPPVMLIHGDLDNVIPVTAMAYTARALTKAGYAVETHVSPGVGHGIDQAGLDLGERFLAKALA